MKLLVELITRMIVLLVTAYVVPGFHIYSYSTALIVALVLGILNMLLKPLLVLFTLPATILSFGLFIFVINAILLILASQFIKGFRIDSFFTAIIAAIVISIVSSILSTIIR